MLIKRSLTLFMLLVTLGLFSQIEKQETSALETPVSIYSMNFEKGLFFLRSPPKFTTQLTNYKFIFPRTNFIPNSIALDLRNFDREVSFEDIMDNYQKRELNKYFFSGYDLRTIPWRKN